MIQRSLFEGNYLQKKQVCNLSVKQLLQNCFARASITSSCHDTWTMLRRSVAGTAGLLDQRPAEAVPALGQRWGGSPSCDPGRIWNQKIPTVWYAQVMSAFPCLLSHVGSSMPQTLEDLDWMTMNPSHSLHHQLHQLRKTEVGLCQSALSFSLFKFWPVKIGERCSPSGEISIQRGWYLVWNRELFLLIPRSEETGPEETHPGRVKEQQPD